MLELFSSVLMRTPLQSLSKAYNFNEAPSNSMEEGIHISSASFWSEFQRISELSPKEQDKLRLTFAKYWIRSCSRATPYGTFAGSKLIGITDEETEIVLDDIEFHDKKIRLDMNFFSGLISHILHIEEIQKQLKFFPNNTIYEIGSTYRYVEYSIRNNDRSYELVAIDKSEVITEIIQYSKKGASIDQLIELVMGLTNENHHDVNIFIHSLINSQVLISELEPAVTGKDPFDYLIEKLSILNVTGDLLDRLVKIREKLNNPIKGVAYFKEIEDELLQLNISPELPQNIFQLDMFLALNKKSINKKILTKITSQVEELFSLSVPIKNPELQSFITRFYSRFEEMEVPLSLALDSELGLGYARITDSAVGNDDLIESLKIAEAESLKTIEVSYIQDYILNKYHNYLKDKSENIVLTEEELKSFSHRVSNYDFPNSMSIMGALMKNGNELNENNFTFDLFMISGPSAANLLGRFASGDNEINTLTREILLEEESENPEAIYAEIVHLPQARVGNIILRPLFREFEIPYVGLSGAPVGKQVPIDDLLVSIRNGKVFLRSKKNNRQIIPRLTSAHGFSNGSLPVYKFLCDLQFQGLVVPFMWDWAQISRTKHFPRVIYKNLIIRKAQWRIDEVDFKDAEKHNDIKSYIENFRAENKIPRLVVYMEMDNKLLIDFEKKEGIDLLIHYLKRYKSVKLEEFLFNETNCIVTDKNGSLFTNEIIIPVKHKNKVQNPTRSKSIQNAGITRKFAPYSEWLYLKIYTGPRISERLLKKTILEFVEEGKAYNYFEKFFFIRYRDESSHIRIRFYNTNPEKQLILPQKLARLLQPFLDDLTIDKIQIDTYTRELERYDEELIEEVESLFYNDSLAVLRFINLLEGSEGEKYRLLFALRGIDALLDDFELSLEEKQAFSKTCQTVFFQEFGGHPALQKQLNERYRKYQSSIFSHMNKANDLINEVEDAVSIFNIRSEMNRPIVSTIFSKLTGDKIDNRNRLLSSFIHMFINRLFIGNQRKYELVVYHFIEKYYSSVLAMQKKQLLAMK